MWPLIYSDGIVWVRGRVWGDVPAILQRFYVLVFVLSSFAVSFSSFWWVFSLIRREDITKWTKSLISLSKIQGVLSCNTTRLSVSITFNNWPFVFSRTKPYFSSLVKKRCILGGALTICSLWTWVVCDHCVRWNVVHIYIHEYTDRQTELTMDPMIMVMRACHTLLALWIPYGMRRNLKRP